MAGKPSAARTRPGGAATQPPAGRESLGDGRRRMPPLSYESTVPRTLVHRASVAEVFLTDSRRVSEHEFRVAAQLPRDHAFFGDRAFGSASGSRGDAFPHAHDPLLLLEVVRQTGILVAHRFFGVPLGHRFVFRGIGISLAAARALRIGGAPLEVCVATTARPQERHGSLNGLAFDFRLTASDGQLADSAGSALLFAPSAYARLRRHAAPITPNCEPAHAASPLRRASPMRVGRRSRHNVVIGPPRRRRTGPVRSRIVVDEGHPYLFDHPQDHIPGMLLLEAYRQLGTIVAVAATGRPQRLRRLSATFERFLELGRPASCEATVVRADDSGVVAAMTALQDGAVGSRGTLEFERDGG